MFNRLENGLMRGADALVARYRRAPQPEIVRDARIVAHRGIYDNTDVFENTLAAFDAVVDNGVWGIECDVRWTRDGVAVIHHDPDGRRLFGRDRPIDTLDIHELQRVYPLIPTLATVVRRYGRKRHLMIEIKKTAGISIAAVNRSLATDLASLTPGVDFHLMSLSLSFLSAIEAVPRHACLPIARLNVGAAFRAMADAGLAGLTGHYALIGRRRILVLRRQGRSVGTGFVNSRGCLFRELNRGVDWLFSDRPQAIQRHVDRFQPPAWRLDRLAR
ncbi:MAG: glycerophosphodiester phosphodiesterase [Desulfobacterales bacterium]|nr:glycerophosphodiester phosphodiesterase [Desulfobacterales bacterium]